MPVTLEQVDDIARVAELAPAWAELAEATGEWALLRGPRWGLPWLKHYAPTLDAVPMFLVGRDGDKLVGLAPFYERHVRLGPGVRAREVRLVGDAGPRPPALDILVLPGYEEAFATKVVEHLTHAGRTWDVIDLAPLRDPSRARAFLAERLDAAGRKVDSHEAGTTLAVTLSGAALDPDALPPPDPHSHAYGHDNGSLAKGLTALRRLSRLEWGSRDEPSPLADPEGTALLQDVVRDLGPQSGLRLARQEDEHGEVTAAALVVDDGARAVCIGLAVDPERPWDGAKLLSAEARAAALRGRRVLDVITGAVDVEPPPLPVAQRRSLRLRAFNTTTSGALARTYTAFRRRADAAREAPGSAAAGARAAWTRIRGAAASVAGYERLHLYRGELWTRGVVHPDGLEVAELTAESFDALPENERAQILARLELDEGYCREKWRRGDIAVLARLGGRPSGIVWCARAAVPVPELGREVRPGTSECYIHDVFVAPDARGKNVAPSMLEDMARRLRARDVYRAWALIQPQNVASTRAFEKAAYAPVADVIYARTGPENRIMLRPPDPEGRKLLGIS
jgi:GNAT superfamily N-acetyltransferase